METHILFEFGRASDMDTNAHVLEMRFRKLLMMMHMLWIKMTTTSAHRYCSSWKVTQLDEKRNRERSPLHARVKMLHIMCGKNYSTSARKMLDNVLEKMLNIDANLPHMLRAL